MGMGFKSGLPVALTALALSVSGCGKRNDRDNLYACPAEDLAKAQARAKSGQAACFEDKDCNPSVAMVTAAWGAPEPKVTGCTGFLVGPDILATNSHCLPGDLNRPGISCADRIWAFFPPMSGFGEEIAECDSVISATGHSEVTPGQDIAFLKLKASSARPALKLSREGLPDGKAFEVVKVNPQSASGCDGQPLGQMQKVTCSTIQHSLYLPSFNDKFSPIAAFGTPKDDELSPPCTIVHGNSGSPILDGNGAAVGIIQAVFLPRKTSKEFLLDGRASIPAMGTNMACVVTPTSSGGHFSSACNQFPGSDDERFSEQWDKQVIHRLEIAADAEFAEIEEENPTGIRWKATPVQAQSPLFPAAYARSHTDFFVSPIPRCFYRTSRPRTTFPYPILHYRLGFDRYLVRDFRREEDPVPRSGDLVIDGNETSILTQDEREQPVVLPAGANLQVCNP